MTYETIKRHAKKEIIYYCHLTNGYYKTYGNRNEQIEKALFYGYREIDNALERGYITERQAKNLKNHVKKWLLDLYNDYLKKDLNQ